MISYDPLFKTLKDRNLVISDLRNKPLHPTTIAKINRGESISLTKVDELCKVLNVKIQDIVEIILED